MRVTLGTIGHFVLIVACLVGLLDLRTDNRKWWKFAGGCLITLAYFALIVIIAATRRGAGMVLPTFQQ